ncbi:energy transducer TonB, partial [Pseudomonas aeruginosa]
GTAFYPGNGITPGPGGFVLDPSRPVEVNWRQSVLGPRLQSSQNTGQRLLLGFDGRFAGWDYDIGASYNQNKVVDHIHSGYVDDRAAALGIANGTLNPFGPQTDAGLAYLGSHALSGDFRTSVGRVKGLDARASREIGDWFGAGPAALALGGEFRKEAFHQDIRDFAGNVQSLGVDPAATVSGERNLKAQYAELNVPVLD